MKSKIFFIFLSILATMLSTLTRPASAQSESGDATTTSYGLVVAPGFFWKRGGIDRSESGKFGREVSLNLTKNDQGAFSFAGIVIGGDDNHTYGEIQAGGSGWLLATLVLGIGGARVRDVNDVIPQASISFQFYSPFFVYARSYARALSENKTGGTAKTHWGIMIKVPIPLPGKGQPLL